MYKTANTFSTAKLLLHKLDFATIDLVMAHSAIALAGRCWISFGDLVLVRVSFGRNHLLALLHFIETSFMDCSAFMHLALDALKLRVRALGCRTGFARGVC